MHQLNRVHKIGNVVRSVVVVLQQDRAIYDEGEERFIKSHRELPAMNPLETWPYGNTAEIYNPRDPFKGRKGPSISEKQRVGLGHRHSRTGQNTLVEHPRNTSQAGGQ